MPGRAVVFAAELDRGSGAFGQGQSPRGDPVCDQVAPNAGAHRPGAVLAALLFVGDAGYGDVAELRSKLNARLRQYPLKVMLTTAVWALGTGPERPQSPVGKMGRPRTQYRNGEHLTVSVADLVLSQTQEGLRELADMPRKP